MPIKDTQITNKQHAVPQNIMDVEFKLIGDLTMRQFAYLFVFGGGAWLAFVSVGGFFKWPAVIICVIIGVGLAFVPIEDRGMDQWVINFFKAVYTPNQKIWKKDLVYPSAFMYQNLAVVRQELITLAPTSSRRKLEDYLEFQGKGAAFDKYDIPEQEYIKKVRDAFAGEQSFTPPPPYVSVAVEELHPILEVPEPGISTTTIVEEPPQPPVQKELEKEKIAQPLPQPVPSTPQTPAISATSVISQPREQLLQQAGSPELKTESVITQIRRPQPMPAFRIPVRRGVDVTLAPLTPDQHAGRRFMSLLPSQGELILPIRGEKILETTEEIEIEKDIEEKTTQLQKLIDQIKQGELYKGAARKTPETTTPFKPPEQQAAVPETIKQDLGKETQTIIETIKAENARLSGDIQKLKEELGKSKQQQFQVSEQELTQKREMLQHLEQEKSKAVSSYQQLQSRVSELQSKLTEQEKVAPYLSAEPAEEKTPSFATVPPLPDKANVITGVVKTSDNLALEGIVVIVKNQKGEPVRAVKTNVLGQFTLTTPLTGGVYTIEINKSNKNKYYFDIISVEAKGSIINPIEFVGR